MGQKSKRRIREDSPDRLSNLPDSILEHILSFVDAVSAVQTSVLSPRWRYVWKGISNLYFHAQSVKHSWNPNFETFVDKVLSLRHGSKVDEIDFLDYEDDCGLDLYQRVVHYAVSHHAQRLRLHFHLFKSFVEFSDLFGSISCPDLKTLRLGDIGFLEAGSCCFQTLATLELSGCLLKFEEDKLDCSLNFPCLTNLSIFHCFSEAPIKVYAPQLLTLKIDHSDPIANLSIEIIAPNLKFFRLEVVAGSRHNRGVPDFSIPYVDRAEILVNQYYNSDKESMESDLDMVFRGLRNARSLLLRCTTCQLEDPIDFDPGSTCFPTLTTLELSSCQLNFKEDQLDCSLNFPCLTNLSISECSSDKIITVYAPQLHTLKMDRGNCKISIEIIAPNLKFFRLEVQLVHYGRGVPDFSIPYVDRAEISIKEYNKSVGKSMDMAFPGLRNAKSLLLRCATYETLKKVRKFLKQKPLCFTKLESLVCISETPYEVVNCPVEGSLGKEPNAKRFRLFGVMMHSSGGNISG